MTLVSLHLPKTAGTSFGSSLRDHFGDTLLEDYGDEGISKSRTERNLSALLSGVRIGRQGLDEINCVHGHFLPLKYRLLARRQDLEFVTWMRDPIDRMVSHFNFWQETYDRETSAQHHRVVVEEGWTLKQFCCSPKFRNIYSQYLWGFPLQRFAFIGITEHYEEDLEYFSGRFLSDSLWHQRLNATTSETASPIDAEFRLKLEAFHHKDMSLYRQACRSRETRLE